MKKAIGAVLTLGGAILLIMGVAGLFGTAIAAGEPWVYTILGLIFFVAGISLLRTVKSTEGPIDPRV